MRMNLWWKNILKCLANNWRLGELIRRMFLSSWMQVLTAGDRCFRYQTPPPKTWVTVRLPAHLPENKSCYVSGLPVRGVKKVRQSHCGEGSQDIRAVQGIIQPLGAPPATRNWKHRNRCQLQGCETKLNRSQGCNRMNEWHGVAPRPLTVSDGVSQQTHGANRSFTLHTSHAGPATSLLSSPSFSPCLRGRLRGWTSRSLITFQKHIFMVLNRLPWRGRVKKGKDKQSGEEEWKCFDHTETDWPQSLNQWCYFAW